MRLLIALFLLLVPVSALAQCAAADATQPSATIRPTADPLSFEIEFTTAKEARLVMVTLLLRGSGLRLRQGTDGSGSSPVIAKLFPESAGYRRMTLALDAALPAGTSTIRFSFAFIRKARLTYVGLSREEAFLWKPDADSAACVGIAADPAAWGEPAPPDRKRIRKRTRPRS